MKKAFIFIMALSAFVLLLTPNVLPDNFQIAGAISDVAEEDVVIIFNSGGWGNTPPEEANDFVPIVEGIKNTLGELGYSSIIVPYNRTKDGFPGKVTGIREFLDSFDVSSTNLAKAIEELKTKFPNKKIIMAGLSNGATLVNETYERISDNIRESVYAVSVGAPFWADKVNSDNMLDIDGSSDSLARGDIGSLAFSALKAPFEWISAKLSGRSLSFSEIMHAAGHDYSWSSSEVSPRIVAFLEAKFCEE
jgi:hypothetical protein